MNPGIRLNARISRWNVGAENSGPAEVSLDDLTSDELDALSSLKPVSVSPLGRTATLSGHLGALRKLSDSFPDLLQAITRARDAFKKTTWMLSRGERELPLGQKTVVMGILNVTPDSFSDGGNYNELEQATRHAREMILAGAGIIDIGGESTRPGAEVVTSADEQERVIPVIEAIREHSDIWISIDTRNAETARAALDAGADIVNDVSGLRHDPEMAPLVADRQAPVIVMHMQGTPSNMQDNPEYNDVVGDVCRYLRTSIQQLADADGSEEQVIVDPGIGFGKTLAHNLAILHRLPELRSLGRPILVGASRKRFIGTILDTETDQRVEGTLAAHAAAVLGGASIIRVHDVLEASRASRVLDAIRTESNA